jgi:cytochrome bd-type quinol oxidase subunit 2
MSNFKKSFGIGSFSFILFLFSFIFTSLNVNTQNITHTQKLGELILNFFNINVAYDFITVILLILAIYLGKKYEQHLFATLGKFLSIILLALFAIFILFALIQRLI